MGVAISGLNGQRRALLQGEDVRIGFQLEIGCESAPGLGGFDTICGLSPREIHASAQAVGIPWPGLDASQHCT